jgi:oligoendopeptidase F
MKFSEFKYERPNLEQTIKEIENLLEVISADQDYEAVKKAVFGMFTIQDQIGTHGTLVSIRNSVDTTDEFYEKEQDFFNEKVPHLQQYEHMFVRKNCLVSKFRKQMEKEFGAFHV